MTLSEKFSSGLRLSDAARELAGSEAVDELDGIARWCLDNNVLRGTPRHEEWRRAYNDYTTRKLLMERDLIEALKDGHLVATGLDTRQDASSGAVEIAPERWHALKPDFSASSATIADYQLAGIRVFAPDALRSTAKGDARQPVSDAELKKWHARYVDGLRRNGRTTSLKGDIAAAREEFDTRVTVARVRSLRESMPDDLKGKRGRPRAASREEN